MDDFQCLYVNNQCEPVLHFFREFRHHPLRDEKDLCLRVGEDVGHLAF